MIIEILPKEGIGGGKVLRLSVHQVLVRQDNGTPVMIAADYGGDASMIVASAVHNAAEFQQTLRQLGIGMTVLVDRIAMPPPPPGARLISGH